MAVILHNLNDFDDPLLLEDGVLWELGGVAWHRMVVSGIGTRFQVVDEPEMSGFCCDHCNPDVDLRPQVSVNEQVSERAWIHDGNVLGFGETRWRVEARRGHVSRLRDLFRVAPPPTPKRFRELLDAFEATLDPEAAGGLLRFAHAPGRQNELGHGVLRALPQLPRATEAQRVAGSALAIGLARMSVIPRPTAKRLLEQTIADRGVDGWLHISALSVLALDEGAIDHANDLKALVMKALEEGDAPAAVAQACESLALVLEDEPLRSLGEAARAVVTDASARKRRTMAVSVLAALAERDAECARAVLRAATDPHENVRAAAARALATFPTAHARSADAALLGLLGDANDDVFEEAFAALFGGAERRVSPESLLAEVDRAGNDAQRLARLTQVLDRLA